MRNKLRALALVPMLGALVLSISLLTAQYKEKEKHKNHPGTKTQNGHVMNADRPDLIGFDAKVDVKKKGEDRSATVEVMLSGFTIVDPAETKGVQKGQGHFHYRLDNGPVVIATTGKKLSFHMLPPGRHTILVQLADNEHQPVGPEKTLEVQAP